MSEARDFWSRRRAGVAAEAEADKAAMDAQLVAEDHAALDDLSEAEVLASLDLPDPDTLTLGDDFSVFMDKAVPDALRRRALRTLWRSNPVLANVDMLVDYGEDFSDAATVVENLQTAYQVGKGMLKHVEEIARQEAEAAAEADETPAPEEIEEQAEPEVIVAVVEAPEPVQPEDTDDATPAPRRMKFRVEESA